MQPNNLQYVNPNFSGVSSDYASRNSGQLVGNTPAPQLPPVIDAGTLGSAKTQLPNLPSTAPTTDLASILGTGVDTSALETAKTDTQNKLLEQQKALSEKAAFQSQAETNAGVLEYKKQLKDITAQITQLQNESASAMNQQQMRTGPQFAIDATKADIERVRTIKALGLSSMAQAIQGNLAYAQDLADRAVKEKYAPIEAQIEYLKTALDINKDNLSSAEKKKAEQQRVLLDERTRLLEQEKADTKSINDTMLEAAKNYAPATVLSSIQNAKTPREAIEIASKYLSSGKYETIKYTTEDSLGNKRENIAVFNKTTGEFVSGKPPTGSISTSNLPGTITPAQDKAIEGAVRTLKFGSVADKKDARNNIASLLSTGDVTGAKEALRQYVDNSVPQTKLDVIEGKKDAIRQLNNIKEKLAIFQANNGDTNIFTGLSQKALEKGGFAKDDPLINDIANSIALAIVDYRRAVSGAAFTESEKKAYDAIFPSTGNTPALNKVKFDSLVEKFNGDIEGFYKEKIGPTKYNEIFQSGDPLKIGTTSIKNDPLDLGI